MLRVALDYGSEQGKESFDVICDLLCAQLGLAEESIDERDRHLNQGD